MSHEGGLYTVDEAAIALGISPSAIRTAIARGRLATAGKIGKRLNRIAPDEVERYRGESLGRHGWEKRKDPDYIPNRRRAEYQRAYRERRGVRRDSTVGSFPITPEVATSEPPSTKG